MINWISASDLRGLNKRRESKFRVGSQVWQKHLKKPGHIGRNMLNTAIKMKTVWKPWMIKIIKLHLRKLDNIKILFLKYLHIVEIMNRIFTIKSDWQHGFQLCCMDHICRFAINSKWPSSFINLVLESDISQTSAC